MKTKIGICTEEWCNMIFEGKNKEYGAFAIRTHASAQQIKSLFLAVSIAVMVSLIPLIKAKIIPALPLVTGSDPVVISVIPTDEPKIPEIKPDLPVTQARPMIRFTPPEVVNENITEEPPTQQMLTTSNAVVGTENREGDPNSLIAPVMGTKITEDKTEIIHEVVDQAPEYTGGYSEMYKFLRKNLIYPEVASAYEVSGSVYVKFVVDKEGKISQVTVSRGVGSGCDEEAIRVIRLMPKWKPGKINGEPVSSYFTIPIVFRLAR